MAHNKLPVAKVRKAINKKFAGVEFYRSPSGYYYFGGVFGYGIPSLYWYSLDEGDLPKILAHVKEHFPKEA